MAPDIKTLPGMNENPEVLSERIPTDITRVLRESIEQGLPTDKTVGNVMAAIRAANSKLAIKEKVKKDKFEAVVKTIIERLKGIDSPDMDDYKAYAYHIALVLCAATTGKILVDPRVSDALLNEPNLEAALNEALATISPVRGACLAAEHGLNAGTMVFSWQTSTIGASGAFADVLDRYDVDLGSPEMTATARLLASLALATAGTKVLLDYKDKVREDMERLPVPSTQDLAEAPVSTRAKQYGRSLGSFWTGAKDYINSGITLRKRVGLGILLVLAQCSDIPTNVMGGGEFILTANDISKQIEKAEAGVAQRKVLILEEFEKIKAKTISQVEEAVDKKIAEELRGDSEVKKSGTGPLYHLKNGVYKEAPESLAYLKSASQPGESAEIRETRKQIAAVLDKSNLIDGKPLTEEVDEVFGKAAEELSKLFEEITKIEEGLEPCFQPGEVMQDKLDQVVKILDDTLELLNKDVPSEIKKRLEKYKKVNVDAVAKAKISAPNVYADAQTSEIKDITTSQVEIANDRIVLDLELRSTATLINKIKIEQGTAAAITVLMLLFLAFGLPASNLDLMTLAPFNAAFTQGKRNEVEHKKALLNQFVEALTTLYDHLLNKGSARELLHTEPIPREYIKGKIEEWVGEQLVRKDGALKRAFSIAEVRDHKARFAAIKELMTGDLSIMYDILLRILPGAAALNLESGDRVAEATNKTDEAIVAGRKAKEKSNLDKVQTKIEQFEAKVSDVEVKDALTSLNGVLSSLQEFFPEGIAFHENDPELKAMGADIANGIKNLADADHTDMTFETAVAGKPLLSELGLKIGGMDTQLKDGVFKNEDQITLSEAFTKLDGIFTEKILSAHLTPVLTQFKQEVGVETITSDSPAEIIKIYVKATDKAEELLADVSTEEKVAAKTLLDAELRKLATLCIAKLEEVLDLDADFSAKDLEQLKAAERKLNQFRFLVVGKPFEEALYPAELETKVNQAYTEIRERRDEIATENEQKRITELNAIDLTNITAQKVTDLLTLLLGKSQAIATLDGGEIVILLNASEDRRLDDQITSMKTKLNAGKGDAIEAVFAGQERRIVANKGKKVVLGSVDAEPNLTENYEMVTDRFGNPVLMVTDRGARPRNEDRLSLNPTTGALTVFDGASAPDSGAFSQAMADAIGSGTNFNLEGGVLEAHTLVKGLTIDKHSFGSIVAAQLKSKTELETSYAGNAQVLIFDSLGNFKWKSTQQATGADNKTVSNPITMDAEANLETGTHPLTNGDIVVMATNGMLLQINETILGPLLAKLDLESPDSIESFLKALEQKSGADNRSLVVFSVKA